MHKRADLEAAIVRKMVKEGKAPAAAKIIAAMLVDEHIKGGQCTQVGDEIILTPAGRQEVHDFRRGRIHNCEKCNEDRNDLNA